MAVTIMYLVCQVIHQEKVLVCVDGMLPLRS